MTIKEEIQYILTYWYGDFKKVEPISEHILEAILSKIVIEKIESQWGSRDWEKIDEYHSQGFNHCIKKLEEIKNKLRE